MKSTKSHIDLLVLLTLCSLWNTASWSREAADQMRVDHEKLQRLAQQTPTGETFTMPAANGNTVTFLRNADGTVTVQMNTPPPTTAGGISTGNITPIARGFAERIASVKTSTASDRQKMEEAGAILAEAEAVVLNEISKLLLPAELTAQLFSAGVLEQDAVFVDFKTTPQDSPKAIAAQLASEQGKIVIVANVPNTPTPMTESQVREHFGLASQARVEIAHEGAETAQLDERLRANEFGKVLAMIQQEEVVRLERLVGGSANVLVVTPTGEITYKAIRDLTGKNV